MQTLSKWLVGGGIAAAALIAGYSYTKAADLGGTCCADLEERVAELEAATVRKGNRKVTVTISGQINKALLLINGDQADPHGTLDNLNSPSRLTTTGEAKMGGGYSAGFLLELGVGSAEDKALAGSDDEITIRHNAVWVGTPAGKVWLGHTSTATDGIVEINLANVHVAALPLASWTGFDGPRTQVLRYVTPNLAGFEFSASVNDSLRTDLESWDAALRYAGEFGGIRVAAGIGYSDNGADVTRFSGSASIMHVATGLFLTAHAGKIDGGGEAFGGTAGVERKLVAIGNTTLFIEYAEATDVAAIVSPLGIRTGIVDDITVYGGGIVQSIDALALDLFATYRNVEVMGASADVFMTGARIKF